MGGEGSMKRKTLILLGGEAQHGKDTAAAMAIEQYGFLRFAMGDDIKAVAVQGFGWTGEKTAETEAGRRGRRLLVGIGNTGREYDGEIWIRKALEQVERAGLPPRLVCTDCRLEREFDALTKWGTENGYDVRFVKVRRLDSDGLTPFDNGLGDIRKDVTERGFDRPHDCLLTNVTGRPEVLAAETGFFLESVLDLEKRPPQRLPMALRADEVDEGLPDRLRAGGRVVVSLDFDDTLHLKGPMKRFLEGRLAFFRAVAASPAVTPIIVTSRTGAPTPAGEDGLDEVRRVCSEMGIPVACIISHAGDKAEVLARLGVVQHFEDDVATARRCVAAGVNTFLAAEWSDPELIREWAEHEDLLPVRGFYLRENQTVEDLCRRKLVDPLSMVEEARDEGFSR
jgi:hypothetical protein